MRIIIVLVLILINAVNATIITVGPNGEHKSIQDAINIAKPDDIVEVQNSTYYENVKVDKRLTLRGLDGPIVDAGSNYENGAAIALLADGITLEGLTAIDSMNTAGDPYAGAGIEVRSNNNTIKNNTVRNNYRSGIHIMPGSINNIILGNNISHNIEGIYLRDSENNTIEGNTVANNWDGILLRYSNNNTIAENTLNYNDNGIWLYSSNNNILYRNNFTGNKCDVNTDDADDEFKCVHDLNYSSPPVREDAADGLFNLNDTLAMESCNVASVDVDGWNFTANLSDRWQSGPYELKNDDTAGLSSLLADWTKANMYIKNFTYCNWNGVVLSNAFILPKEGAVIDFKDIPDPQSPYRDEVLAIVEIRIHKAPEDIQGLSPQEILADINGYRLTYPKEGQRKKEIDFNGHPALLIEKDYTSDVFDNTYNPIIHASSIGRISILMNEDTVVSIDVVTRKESGLHAWDIIKKFTIYPT